MKFYIFLASLALYFLATSCEKVIDLDLNTANPKPVFEGLIENDSTCYVKASWTSSYYDNSSSLAITNATMKLTDQNGVSDSLVYEGNGLYRGRNLIGIVGNSYTLTIDLEGKQYTSISQMPVITPIDSISTKLITSSFRDPGYRAYIHYTDAPNVKNYYAKKIITKFDTIYAIRNDEFSDGIATRTSAGSERGLYESGDTLFANFISIDAGTFLYLKTLEKTLQSAGPASATPSNPTSNITGGALGYFSASSKDTVTIIIP